MVRHGSLCHRYDRRSNSPCCHLRVCGPEHNEGAHRNHLQGCVSFPDLSCLGWGPVVSLSIDRSVASFAVDEVASAVREKGERDGVRKDDGLSLRKGCYTTCELTARMKKSSGS